MHPAEIVIREVQGYSGFQMRQLLAERIGEPRKSPHRHSHSQVLPLHKRSADMVRVGVTLSDFGYNPRDAWWGVPRIGGVELPEVAKHFRKLCEVHVRSKALRYGHGVVVQSVRGELDAVCNALVQVPQESPRIKPHALADPERRNQFCFRVNRNVNPLVANLGRIATANVAAFLADVRPNLIDLQIPGAEVSHSRVHQSVAAFASDKQKAHDRVAVESSEALSAADGASFQQAVQSTFCRFGADTHRAKGRLGLGFSEGCATGIAAPALDSTLAVGAESLAGLVLAFYAGHGLFSACVMRESRYNKFGSDERLTPRFGLALPTAETGDRADFCQLVNWWGSGHGLLPSSLKRPALQGVFAFGSKIIFRSYPLPEGPASW